MTLNNGLVDRKDLDRKQETNLAPENTCSLSRRYCLQHDADVAGIVWPSQPKKGIEVQPMWSFKPKKG